MDTTTPSARTPQTLRASWEQLVDPPAPGARSLWIAVVDGDTRRLSSLVQEVAHLPAEPTPGDAAQLERFLDQLAGSVLRGRHGVAVAVSRPGGPRPDRDDIAWVEAVYEACAAVEVRTETVHLVADAGAFPVSRADVRAARAAQRPRRSRSTMAS
ncbi:MAG TPA: hypothetical protein VGE77_08105 [Nocardioides sp.]